MADLSEQATATLEELVRSLTAQIQRLTLKLDTQRGTSLLARDSAALSNALRIREQIAQTLVARGKQMTFDVVLEYTRRSAELEAKKYGEMGRFNVNFGSVIERIAKDTDKMAGQPWEAAAESVKLAVYKTQANGLPIEDLLVDISQKIQTTTDRAQTLVSQMVNRTGAVALEEFVKENPEIEAVAKYKYTGANPDGIIRPFCERLMRTPDREYTREEIDRMDNGQGLPVFTDRGGWKCRHEWVLVLPTAKE